MKKHLLLLSAAALLFVGTANAQIPNPGFETWSPDLVNGGVKNPNTSDANAGWQTLNLFTSPFLNSNPQSVFQDSTIVHSGKYACKIVSVVLNANEYKDVKAFIPHDTMGIVVSGTITATPAFKLGVPYTSRPVSFNFFYQYFPQSASGKPDTAFCTVVLSRSPGGVRHTIGAGITMLNAAASWTMGTVSIVYDSGWSTPIDTITVLFSSSSFHKPVPGSILYVDDASGLMGINDLHAPSANVNVYPNPASNSVNFNIASANGSVAGYSIEVYDITGKKVNAYRVTNSLTTVNTDAYSSGLYFYQLFDQSGAQLNVGKFSVVK
jgi:hypothetical protein